jgi:zinc protease
VDAQNPNWPSESAPRPLAPREVKFPQYEVRTLANGMQVMAILHHEQPAVTVRVLVRAGGSQDPDKKDGVASLTAQLLDQGTTTKTAAEIADQIDSIGGALGTGSSPDWISANTIVMKDSFDVALNLLADVIRNPAFAPEEIERQKEQLTSSLRVNAEDPEYVANVVFDRLVYGAHPYGLPGTGTPETIGGITREDLRAFHRRYFVPNNMILAIVGDLTSQEAFGAAERVFGSWPRADVAPVAPIEAPQPARRIIVIDKPDAVQTEIRAGQLAIPRKHPDYLAWDLAVKILGGEGANRLHRVLRSERGLTYGASADVTAMKQAGNFVAETDTRTETTGEALDLIVSEMSRLLQQRVSERELGDAQAYLAGSFPLTIETPNDIAAQVLQAVFYELPLQEISTFRERVLAVTPDDIQRVAKQYIRPDRLSIVLVGNAKAFLPQLQKRGLPDLEVIPLAQLDLTSPTLRRDRPTAARGAAVARSAGAGGSVIPVSAQVSPRPQTGTRPAGATPAPRPPTGAAAELLRRVVDARGGLAALKGVRTVVADSETTFLGDQGAVGATTQTKTYVVYPDKFRVDVTVQEDQISQIYNAGRMWEKNPIGVREMPPAARQDAEASVRRDAIPLLLAAMEGSVATRALPDERGADGRPLRVLEMSGAGLDPVRVYVDDQFLIVKQSYSAPGPDGRPARAEEAFSDYRQIGGVRVPFEAAVSRDGRVLVKRTITKVTFNEPLAETLFAKPQ